MTYVMWLSVLDTTLDLSFCICFVWIVCVCICICGQGLCIFLAFWLALRWHCDVWVQVNSTMHVDKTDCSEHKFDQAAPALAWLEAAVGRRNVKATGADTKNFPANVSWEFAGCLDVLTFNAFSLNRSFGSYFVGPCSTCQEETRYHPAVTWSYACISISQSMVKGEMLSWMLWT